MKKCSWTLIIAYILLLKNHAYAQWVQTNGPYGETVYSFAVSDGTIFRALVTLMYFVLTLKRILTHLQSNVVTIKLLRIDEFWS